MMRFKEFLREGLMGAVEPLLGEGGKKKKKKKKRTEGGTGGGPDQQMQYPPGKYQGGLGDGNARGTIL